VVTPSRFRVVSISLGSYMKRNAGGMRREPMEGKKGLGRTGHKAVIGGMLALVVAMGIGRFAFTPALVFMQRDLGLSDAGGGQLASINYAGYLIGALLAASVRTGSRQMPFLFFLSISVISTGLMALSSDPLFWSVLRFSSGMASAFLFVLASGMAMDTLPGDGRGTGLLYSGVGSGIALTGMIAPYGDALGGWAGAWLVFGVAALLLSIPAAVLLREPEVPARHVSPPKAQAIPFRALLFSYFCGGLGYIITGTFLVVIAERMPAMSGMGNTVWIFVGLAAVPSCVVWARLGVYWGLGTALRVAYFILAVGIVLPVLSTTAPAFLLSAVLYGGSFMGIVLLTMSLGKLSMPGDSGKAVGLLTAVFGIGQILGPWLAGSGAEHFGSFSVPLLGAGGIVMLGGLSLQAVRARSASMT
jgi:predicted MFS family arabinose efflux permease